MKELKAYVEQQNQWNAIFKGRQYNLANPADRQSLAQKIDSDLSPENLSCDGELTRSQVQARYRELNGAARDLVRLDPSVAQFMCEFG